MKRFWLVLLSLGLVMAFSASAFAVDVKVSGSYYAAGVYLDQTNLNEESAANAGQSTAFYFQRLRVGTELIVSPGLSLVTRFDAMERVWGASRTAPTSTSTTTFDPVTGAYTTTTTTTNAMQANSAGTVAENENIAWDYAYVKYDSPIGTFQVGAQPGGTYGHVFANSEEPRYRIKYISPDYSGFKWTATIEKNKENDYYVNDASTTTDEDTDTYYLTGDYKAKNWAVGLLYGYTAQSEWRVTPNSTYNDMYGITDATYKAQYHTFNPYFTAAFGPVVLKGEAKWVVGTIDLENPAYGDDFDINSFGAWIDAVGTFGPVYVGGTFAYAQGDVNDDDKIKNVVNGGMDWSPTLIMWNEDRARWIGNVRSASSTTANGGGFDSTFSNAFLYQLRAGVKPVDKLDVCLAVSYAQRDKVAAGFDDELGWEFDLTGTYKITNNLSYMLGAGYLITGDYFKGANEAQDVENNYMIINKLALTF